MLPDVPKDNSSISNDNIKSLWNLVKAVGDEELDLLSRLQDLGNELNFVEAVDVFKESKRLLLEVSPDELIERFPEREKTTRTLLSRWLINVRNVYNFKASGQNPTQQRNALIADAIALRADVIADVFPIVQYRQFLGSEQSETEIRNRYENELHTIRENLLDQHEKILEELQKAKKARLDAEKSSEAAKLAAGQTGVSVQSEFFELEAEENKLLATSWLVATIVSIVVFVATVFLFDAIYGVSSNFFPKQRLYTIDPWIGYLSTKALVLGAVGLVIVMARKNYTTHRHNRIINKHRANALNTYEALVAASGTEAGKEVILQSAAHSIFSHQDTNMAKGNVSNSVGTDQLPKIVLAAPVSSST